MPASEILFGLDLALQDPTAWAGRKIALVTNNAATTRAGVSGRIALQKAGLSVIKLFSPEHGLSAVGKDGAYQQNTRDAVTGLPVISLYGNQLAPTETDLADVDTVFFDIPDLGCRFYTYLWTMTHVMEACSRYRKKMVLLDRPNPTGGDFDMAEGPWLNEMLCSSFIGRWNIPVKHSCTLGELARYFVVLKSLDIDLQVIPAQNWKRKDTIEEGKWFFTAPSPAIKDAATTLLYPGMGLLEGINVNEGRGTDTPFNVFGAPWIDAALLQKSFEGLRLPGVTTMSISYTPVDSMYAEIHCHGLALRVTNHHSFFPVDTGYRLINLLIQLYPNQCRERLYITHANNSGARHLDKLTGLPQAFEKIKNGEWPNQDEIRKQWKTMTAPFLLYG
jgi:uncharacterized protein YbbC (DUF1343 family)